MKISKYISESCVYQGMRTIFGKAHVKWFFEMMHKDGYTIKQCKTLISGAYIPVDMIQGEFIFTKEDIDYLVKVWWEIVGRKNLLSAIYAIKEMEITNAVVQD